MLVMNRIESGFYSICPDCGRTAHFVVCSPQEAYNIFDERKREPCLDCAALESKLGEKEFATLLRIIDRKIEDR